MFVGTYAGMANYGTGNVFIGNNAGYNEPGSNKLYITNTGDDSGHALIYGEFDKKIVKLNALASVRDALILEPRSSVPSEPVRGMMYFDSTSNTVKVYDGEEWHSLW